MRVLVIGGGVIGTTTAFFLAEAGHEVTLVDRQPCLASESSFANGGMLHASHTEPWNTPAAIRQLIRWIGREDSPLLLRPGQLPNLVGWGLNFLRFSHPRHHERNTRVNTRLATYSHRMFTELCGRTGLEYDGARRGILKIFHDQRAMAHGLKAAELMQELGLRCQMLDVDGVTGLEPVLDDIRSELVGGLYYPDDESGDAALFTRGLGKLAAARGVDFRLGETVRQITADAKGISGVTTDRGLLVADRYVLAAGVEAPRLARQLGLRLPIKPVKGYSVTLPVQERPGVPQVPIIDEGRKVVMTRLGDRLRLAGTAEFAGFDYQIRPRRIDTLLRQALANLPRYAASVDERDAQPWACLRPMTVDGPPILGRTPVPNLFLNTGPGHLGWTFAAGAGRVVADLVSDLEPEISLDGLTLDRY